LKYLINITLQGLAQTLLKIHKKETGIEGSFARKTCLLTFFMLWPGIVIGLFSSQF